MKRILACCIFLQVFAPIASATCVGALYGKEIAELAQFYTEIQGMEKLSEKSAAMIDFRKKYRQVVEKYGREVKDQILAVVEDLKSEREADLSRQVAEEHLKQDQQDAIFRGMRHTEVPNIGLVRDFHFLEENLALFPRDGALSIYDVKAKAERRNIPLDGATNSSRVTLSPDKNFAYASVESVVWQIDLRDSAKAPRQAQSIPNNIEMIVHSPTEDQVVIARTGFVRILATSDMREIKTLNLDLPGVLKALEYSSDGRYLLVRAADRPGVLVDMKTFDSVEVPRSYQNVTWIEQKFIPGQNSLLGVSQSGIVYRYDLLSGNLERLDVKNCSLPRYIYPSQDGRHFMLLKGSSISSGENGQYCGIYDLSTGKTLPSTLPEDFVFHQAARTADGRHSVLATLVSEPETSILLDLTTLELWTISLPKSVTKGAKWFSATPMTISPEKNHIFLHANPPVYLW